MHHSHCDESHPNRMPYPTEKALRLVGGDKSMLSSSVALMMVHALIEGYRHLHLTGFSFLDDGPYAFQLAAIQRLICGARARGVSVTGPCVERWLRDGMQDLRPAEWIYALENAEARP